MIVVRGTGNGADGSIQEEEGRVPESMVVMTDGGQVSCLLISSQSLLLSPRASGYGLSKKKERRIVSRCAVRALAICNIGN